MIYLQTLFQLTHLEKILKTMMNVTKFLVQWLNSVVEKDVELVEDHHFAKLENVVKKEDLMAAGNVLILKLVQNLNF